MVQEDKYQKHIFRICLLGCLITLFLVMFLGYTYMHSTSSMLEDAKEKARNQAKDAAAEIDTNLINLVTVSESITNDLNSGKLEDDKVSARLRNTLQEHPELYGVVVAYKPYAYNSTTRLYAPYYVWGQNEPQLIQIEEVYDYTQPDVNDGISPRTVWYNQPLVEGAGWVEPYFGTASDTLLVLYALPFYSPNGSNQEMTPTGVTSAVYSLNGVRSLVGSFDLGPTGYGYIISDKGTVVSHPIQEYLGKNITFLHENDETLRGINQDIVHGKYQEIHNPYTGQTSLVFHELIPSTNWTLGVVFVEEEIFQEAKTFNRHLKIAFVMAFLGLMFFISTLFFRLDRGDHLNLWIIVMILSILCLSGMVFVWSLALEESSAKDQRNIEIYDRVGLEKALYTPEYQVEPVLRVPTGVFLQSIEFSSANNVIVTGYIWQNYSNIEDDDISQGFIFPEAESMDVEETYREGDVVGWYFRSVLRQPFDYSEYPFDSEEVWIRLWHKDFYKNIILTPDMSSYEFINAEQKPGLEHDFVLKGWKIQNSFYSYRKNSYNTDFGLAEFKQDLPELYFNVGMKRDFFGSIISNLIPLTVVSILLFAVLLISTKSEEKISLYGFSSSTVLGYCAALFFVLIISHVSLRDKLAAVGIIYLEYFYFVLYFVILVVSLNSILLASTTRCFIVDCMDNLFIKLLYWPVLLGLLLIITIINFY
ncbi:MAG TPA: Cache 3/Cache 2 fusion domain-containing protein [Candidatus Nanoarchaeia archaeon]|nr:Cache 3/Cache 2 fusion domain-containing protein [Candidatus Nanoarchaeia archaeon]